MDWGVLYKEHKNVQIFIFACINSYTLLPYYTEQNRNFALILSVISQPIPILCKNKPSHEAMNNNALITLCTAATCQKPSKAHFDAHVGLVQYTSRMLFVDFVLTR